MLPKFMLPPLRVVLFWVMLNANDPNCCPVVLASVSDHAPVAGFDVVCEELLLPPPHATSTTASMDAKRTALKYFNCNLSFIWVLQERRCAAAGQGCEGVVDIVLRRGGLSQSREPISR